MPQSQARLHPAQYTFAPANRQITFAGVPGFSVDGLVLVTNAASGKVIFDPEDESGALGYTAVAGNVVTLAYDTTGMNAADPLRIIYNDLSRDDRLIVYTPTISGPLPAVACSSFQSAILDVQSSTSIQGQLEGTVDGTQWKAITGQLPNLDSNPGDVNWNQGTPFNMRQYDITAYAFIRVNPTSMSTGSPKLNLLMKTVPAPVRKFISNGGSVVANFDSGGSVGYVRTTSLNSEVWRGALQSGATVTTGSLSGGVLSAGAVITGGARQAFGQPNPYYNRYGATVVSDQPGTLRVECSTDNGANWIKVAEQPVVAGVSLDVEVKIRAGWYRSIFTNGNTATGANAFSLLTAFCGA